MLDLLTAGTLPLARLIGRHISLDDACAALANLATSPETGITIIDRFAA
jgi:hypothetical protein